MLLSTTCASPYTQQHTARHASGHWCGSFPTFSSHVTAAPPLHSTSQVLQRFEGVGRQPLAPPLPLCDLMAMALELEVARGAWKVGFYMHAYHWRHGIGNMMQYIVMVRW